MIGNDIRILLFICVIRYAEINPKDTINNGINFIHVGSINIDDPTKGIHDIVAPATIDKDDKAIIGLIMFICSLVLIRVGPKNEPHIVVIENRVE